MNKLNQSLISAISVIIGVSILFFPTPGKADASFSQLNAYARSKSVEVSDIKSLPPVQAQIGADVFGRALTNSKFECEANARGDYVGEGYSTYGSTESSIIADYIWAGAYKSITLGFNYFLSVATSDYGHAEFEGNAEIDASLRDLTANNLLWDFSKEAHGGVPAGQPGEEISGNVNELIMFIPGHVLALHLAISNVDAYAAASMFTEGSYAEVHTKAWLNDIDIRLAPAAPIPAALYLLSSGLIGLLGLRMYKKKN